MGQHFDTFVRLMASRPSRRGIVRGEAGLAAAFALALAPSGGADAHHALIALGGVCRHTNQCLHHAPTSRRRRPSWQAVYCADNGFRYDGPLNCCRNRGRLRARRGLLRRGTSAAAGFAPISGRGWAPR